MTAYTQDCLYLYGFNNASTSNIYDISGNGHDGTLTSIAKLKNKLSGFYSADASSSTITLPSSLYTPLQSDNDGSIAMLFIVDSIAGGGGCPLSYWQDSNNELYWLLYAGNLYCVMKISAASTYPTIQPIVTGKYYLATHTSDGTNHYLYLNGVQTSAAETNWTNNLTISAVTLASRPSGEKFDGRILFAMHNRRFMSLQEHKDLLRKLYIV